MLAHLAAAVLVIAFSAQDPAPMQSPAPPAPPARKLNLTFDSQGRVTLVAQNVTVSEILAEWSRKGGTKIQGAERLAGGPMLIPMQFDQRPELEVIEALTRGAAGVSVAPRRAGTPGASQFETVYILATSAATQASPYSSAPSMTVQQPIRGVPDEEIPPVTAPGAPGNGQQAPPAAPRPPAGAPGGSVIVPVVPVGPAGTAGPTGRGGGGGTTTTTTGRGGGGGGGSR
jgi:hypothetical protein